MKTITKGEFEIYMVTKLNCAKCKNKDKCSRTDLINCFAKKILRIKSN